MSDLTTVANVVGYLGLSDTAATAANSLLARLVSAASAFLEQNLNRTFEVTEYVETRNGHDERFITFGDYPVASVQSVVISGVTVPPAPDMTSNGYLFDSTRLSLSGYRFYRGYLNVELQYTAGFVTIPLEIEQACIELVSAKYKGRDRIGVSAKTINGETISFTRSDLTEDLKSVLRAYQKVVPC